MSISVEAAMSGGDYIWGAPTYDQVRVGWNETRRADPNKIVDFNESRMVATFPNGGHIIYRSMDDPDNARGHSAKGVVFDEIADIKPSAYYEVVRPMLIDTGGWFWGIGSSKGRDWVYSEQESAKNRDDTMSWRAPTLGVELVQIDDDVTIRRAPHPLENPFIPFEEIKRLFESMKRAGQLYVFRQEIGSDPDAAPGGRVYEVWQDDEYPGGNVTIDAEYVPNAGEILWACDDGYAGRYDPDVGGYTADSHPVVYLLVQVRKDGKLCVFAEYYAIKKLHPADIHEVLAMDYPLPDYVVVDKSAASFRGHLASCDISSANSSCNVDEGVKNLRAMLGPDENGVRHIIVHPRCKNLRFEMKQYLYDDSKMPKVPFKRYDHGPDALRYIAWAKRYG